MKLPLLAALLLAAAPLSAGDFSTAARGTTAVDFLNLGVGGRATAMGGAYTAVADEASAVYWNPAAMTKVEKRSITVMHSNYIGTSFYDYGGYVHNAQEFGFFGGSFQYFSPGRLVQTDEAGNQIGGFIPYDMAFSLAYARKVEGFAPLSALNGYSFGVTMKLINSRLITSAGAGAVDLGVLSPAYFGDRLRLALAAYNLGGDAMQFEQAKETLPVNVRLGSAYKISGPWTASLDATFPRGDQAYASAGTEYWLAQSGPWKLAGRAGYSTQTVSSVTGITGVSLGFGIGARAYSIDYAFAPIGSLGQAHRLSVTYNF